MKTDSERADLYYRLYRKEVIAHAETKRKNLRARGELLLELDRRAKAYDTLADSFELLSQTAMRRHAQIDE
jgi:hypothetical protein